LTVSRAAVLASLLPQWDEHWPEQLLSKFPTEESYQQWFTRFLGILGDPVAARKLIDHEQASGIRTPGNKYGYRRAFTYNPPQEDVETMIDLLQHTWGVQQLSVLDPMAGGGSIPFESLRFGFSTYAGELNPVASVVLTATLDYPARYGLELGDHILKWGKRWYELAVAKLRPYFEPPPGAPRRTIYLWARTVACPTTGKAVPLSPNWWISKAPKAIAARLLTNPDWQEPRFELVRGDAIDFDPDEGTVSRGVGRSPWTGDVIDGDYIKREAQGGRMGQLLYAVEVNTPSGKEYQTPAEGDKEAARRAEAALAENLPRWEAAGLVPREPFPKDSNDPRPLHYGMPTWADFFSPRQLLSLLTFLETLREVGVELGKELPAEQAKAVETYLAFAIDKAADYNSRMSHWHSGRTVMVNKFQRHDYSFKWSHGEFNATANLLPWALSQIEDSYRDLAQLVAPAQLAFWRTEVGRPLDRLHVWKGSSDSMQHVDDGSVHLVCVDPPYYDNVMYAELSDFFYVWLKRSVGHLYPDFFRDQLTSKDEEAVANPARFADMGRKKGELAEQDYQRKMGAAFREMHRVLHPQGVLTVMFTHKRVEAWDTLATALIGAGFAVKASWPVHTESEHSLHQARKNAAASTILLVCRKRSAEGEPVWWDDIRGHVRRVARVKAEEFAARGIGGVDLYISTFGPALSVISENWPVLTSEVDEKTGQPKPLRPETALDLAREEVIALRKRGLLLGREVQFDPITDWYLMAWDAFRAEEFPADEARKLAIALGLDVEADLVRGKRVIAKKGSYVTLQKPKQRRRRGLADPEAVVFDTLLDAAHAAMLIYQEDGAKACESFLRNTGLLNDGTFKACLQALLNAVPRTKIKDKFVRVEAELLENMRLAFFEDLTPPPDEGLPSLDPEQIGLWDSDEHETAD
jgi:adenine-specific DNA methylase